jgi:hypothetical protein
MKKTISILIIVVLTAGAILAYRQFENNKGQIKTDPTFYEIKGKIIDGFPSDFPVYPGAKLEGSASVNPPTTNDEGYRIKWEINTESATVPEIMRWYEQELPAAGWEYTPPDDYDSMGEQVARIKQGELEGYIAAEVEDSYTEIIVDVRKD